MAFYILHRLRVGLVDRADLICRLQAGLKVWGLFLSPTAPGFQLFYFHLCRWVVHCGLAPEAFLEVLGLPSDGQEWRWCSWLGHRVSGNTRYSRQSVAAVVGNTVLQEGMATALANTLQYSCLETPLSDREAGQDTFYRVKRVRQDRSDPVRINTDLLLLLLLFSLLQLCPSES